MDFICVKYGKEISHAQKFEILTMKKKPVREKGKLKFSRYFQEFRDGDRVSIVREVSVNSNFPERFQGRSGVIDGRRGRAYSVRINDQNKEKIFLIEPIHLRKLK